MKIGIVSFINPSELQEFLTDKDIPNTQVMASSVHALIGGLVSTGNSVMVFSPVSFKYTKKKCLILRGERLSIFLIRIIPNDSLIRHYYLPHRIARFIRRNLADIDVLHAHWTYECSSAIVPFVDKIPSFCSVRDWWPIQYQFSRNKGLIERIKWGWVKKNMFYKTMNESNIHFIANSDYTRQQILSLFPYYNIPIIPNPIRETDLNSKRKFAYNGVFISIANSLFEERKNIVTLLKAFSLFHQEHPDSTLLLIGDYSTDNPTYKEWKNSGLLSGVCFCGKISHKEVIEQLDSASVMIHPSLEETFGNILLEGIARKLLVVGGESAGAVPSILGYGKYGILCDVSDYQSVLTSMHDLSKGSIRYQEVVEDAFSHLENNYSASSVAKQHLTMYRAAL